MSTPTVASSHGVQLRVHELAGAAVSATAHGSLDTDESLNTDESLGTAGRAPVVLAAHATGFHGLTWRPLARSLAARTAVRVIAPDLRGHGHSPLPHGVVLDWDGFADDVLAVIDALAGNAPIIIGIGHSKGGAALLRAETRRPGTFAAIWCYEPIVIPGDIARGRWEDNPLAIGAERRRDTFESREAALDNYAAKPPMASFDPEVLAAYVEGGFEDVPGGGVRLRCRPEVEAETYRMGGAHDTFEHLDAVRCQTIVACGRADPGSPALFARRVADALPAGELVAYDDLDHFGPLEAPDRLAADISALVTDSTAAR